jgi:WD40 repeat protein
MQFTNSTKKAVVIFMLGAIVLGSHIGLAQGYPWSYMALSPDGTMVAVAGRTYTSGEQIRYPIDILDANTGVLLSSLLTTGTGPILGLSWSPDSSRLASSTGRGDIDIWDVGSASAAVSLNNDGSEAAVSKLTWGPDGSHLLVAMGHTIFSLDPNPGGDLTQEQFSLYHEPGQVSGLAWNTDSSLLAATGGGYLTVWDIADPNFSLVTQFDSSGFSGPVWWSHDSRRLAVGGYEGIVIYDTTTWAVQQTLPLPGDGFSSVAWNADDTLLAGSTPDTVYSWDVATGEVVDTYATPWVVWNLAWHPEDNTRLFYNGSDGQVYINGAVLGSPIASAGPDQTPTDGSGDDIATPQSHIGEYNARQVISTGGPHVR